LPNNPRHDRGKHFVEVLRDLSHTFGTTLAEVGFSEAAIADLRATLIPKLRDATHMQLTEQCELR
jgi:hypothetical protein